jgi:fumarate reductase subunit C
MTGYTGFHQRLYRRPVRLSWWLRRWSYLVFVLRELSSLFVAWSVGFTLVAVYAVAAGEAQYRRFLVWTAQSWVIAVDAVALLFLVFHAVTWFNLAPRAMAPRLRGRPVPARWVAGANYVLWALVSAVVAGLILKWAGTSG